MNYEDHNITTARVNPNNRDEAEDLQEAEEQAETVLKDLVKTSEKKDSDCQETAREMLDNIQHIKFYGTGGFTICLKRAEEFSLYLIHGKTPKVVDFDKNHVRF